MKYLILLLSTFVISAHAADECASVWAYKPYRTCASPANGLDLSQPGTDPSTIVVTTDWLNGRQNQQQACGQKVDEFNRINLNFRRHAELAKPTPVGEKSENHLLTQQYQYACELTSKVYPFKTAASSACGVEDKFSYQVGGSPRNLAGTGVTCLSCDNLANSKPSVIVECLRQNVENIVEPKAIDLRDSDIQAVSAQMNRLLKMSRQVPIENLQTMAQLSFFTDFIEKHPVQNETPSMGGGLGTKPTLQ